MPRLLRQTDDEALERPFNKDQFVRLLRYMIPYKKNVAIALCLMVVAALCSLGQPMLLSNAISDLQAGDSSRTTLLVIGMVAFAAVGAMCTRTRVWLMDQSGRRALARLRQDLFDHIQGMSFSFFDTRSAGKLLVRVINDVNSLNDLFTNGIVNVLVDVFTLIVLMAVMLVVNWKLTLIGMCANAWPFPARPCPPPKQIPWT